AVADVGFGGGDGDGGVRAYEVGGADPVAGGGGGRFEVGLGDEGAHGGDVVAEEEAVVDMCAGAGELDEHVEGVQVGGAVVADDVFGALGGIWVHEPGAASAGGGGGVEHRHDDRCGFRIQETVETGGAVWLFAELQVPLGAQRVLACGDAGQVEFVTGAGGERGQVLDRHLRRRGDERSRRRGEALVGGTARSRGEAGADDLGGPDRDRGGGDRIRDHRLPARCRRQRCRVVASRGRQELRRL